MKNILVSNKKCIFTVNATFAQYTISPCNISLLTDYLPLDIVQICSKVSLCLVAKLNYRLQLTEKLLVFFTCTIKCIINEMSILILERARSHRNFCGADSLWWCTVLWKTNKCRNMWEISSWDIQNSWIFSKLSSSLMLYFLLGHLLISFVSLQIFHVFCLLEAFQNITVYTHFHL